MPNYPTHARVLRADVRFDDCDLVVSPDFAGCTVIVLIVFYSVISWPIMYYRHLQVWVFLLSLGGTYLAMGWPLLADFMGST